jgi:MFS family permease
MNQLTNYQRRRFYLLCLASTLIVIILGFTGFLNLSSFEKNYVDSLVSSYRVAGAEAKRTIEYSVKFHKPLDNYAGMGEVLTSVKEQIPTVNNVFLLNTEGQVLYDVNGRALDQSQLNEKLKKLNFSPGYQPIADQNWMYVDGFYHALIPLYAASGDWIGTIDIFFQDAIVKRRLLEHLHATLKVMALIIVIAILANLLVIFRIPLFRKDGEFNIRSVTISLATILTCSQLLFAANNVITLRSAYVEVIHANLNVASNIISDRINHVVRLGLTYGELNDVDIWLRNIVNPLKEVDKAEIFSGAGELLFNTFSKNNSIGEGDVVTKKLISDQVGQFATLTLTISEKYLHEKVLMVILDAGTMFVTSLFFLVELLNFSIILLAKFDSQIGNQKPSSNPKSSWLGRVKSKLSLRENMFHDDKSVRVLSFLLLLSGYMSVSFIPLIMKEIYTPMWGITESFATVLPIMSEMFGAFISSLFVGYFIDRYGWRPIFTSGLLIMAIGTIVSGLTDNLFLFVLARALSGLGYGAAWMGLRGLVATGNSDIQRSSGFSFLNAGIFAGQNCGAVLGALLAERIGFSNVFLIAGILIFLAYPVSFLYVQNKKPSSTGGDCGLRKISKFIFEKENSYFFLLVVIPSAIVGSFLNYFFPLFAKAQGISQGDIGRGFLLYGVCIVFIGPVLVKFLRGKIANQYVIILAGFVGVLGLTIFGVMPTFGGALLAIMLLGLADAIGLSSQNSYFINQESARNLGHGKALSLFSAVKKLGQLSGPAIFGLAISLGVSFGINIIATIYLIAALCFVMYLRIFRD